MILVTGGAGFIGAHVCKALAESGKEVRILDIREPKHKFGEYARGDVRKERDCQRACRGCEGVVHLAAIASVAESVSDPVGNFRTNAIGTQNMLKAAASEGAERFVYSSSAAVYGQPVSVPIPESHPTVPISPYGAAKLAAEKYVLLYSSAGGIGGVALRYFNVYGPGQDPKSPYSGVITKFAEAARGGREIVIFGNGGQSRDFVHVKDVARATVIVLGKKGAAGLAINIGSGQETTIAGLAKEVIALAKRKVAVRHEPASGWDIQRSVADISLAKSVLGFEPKVNIREGLSELVS